MDIKNIVFLFAVLTTSVTCFYVASNSVLHSDLSGESEAAATPADRPFVVEDTGPVATVAPEQRRAVRNRVTFSVAMKDAEAIQARRNARLGSGLETANERQVRYRLKTEYGIEIRD